MKSIALEFICGGLTFLLNPLSVSCSLSHSADQIDTLPLKKKRTCKKLQDTVKLGACLSPDLRKFDGEYRVGATARVVHASGSCGTADKRDQGREGKTR